MIASYLHSIAKKRLFQLPSHVARYALPLLFILRCLESLRGLPAHAHWELPRQSSFHHLLTCADDAGVAIRLDAALNALERANPWHLSGLREIFSFDDDLPLERDEKDRLLQELLHDLGTEGIPDLPDLGDPESVCNIVSDLMAYVDADNAFKAAPWAPSLPRSVAELLIGGAGWTEGETLYDPFCRNGEILIRAQQWRGSSVAPGVRSKVYGQTYDARTAAMVRLLGWLWPESEFTVQHGDVIRDPAFVDRGGDLKRFDVVLSALPPAALSVGDWGYDLATADPYGRFAAGVPPRTRPEMAYLRHMLGCMDPRTGRAAGVFTPGILSRRGTEKVIREHLIKQNLLDAVVALPANTLLETRHPRVLLVFRSRRSTDAILFMDTQRAASESRHGHALDAELVNRIITCVTHRSEQKSIARLVTPEEIARNDGNLHVPRYLRAGDATARPLTEIAQERRRLLDEWQLLSMDADDLMGTDRS